MQSIPSAIVLIAALLIPSFALAQSSGGQLSVPYGSTLVTVTDPGDQTTEDYAILTTDQDPDDPSREVVTSLQFAGQTYDWVGSTRRYTCEALNPDGHIIFQNSGTTSKRYSGSTVEHEGDVSVS